MNKIQNKIKINLQKNIEGKKLIEKNKELYINEIMNVLNEFPEYKDELIAHLEITEESFTNRLNRKENSNITFYDEALKEVNNLKTRTRK